MTVLPLAGGLLAVLLSSGAAAQLAAPLAPLACQELAPSAIRPAGWLRRLLEVVRDYSTGRLAETCSAVRSFNGWLSSTSEGLYRGPVDPAPAPLTFIPYGCTKLRVVALPVVP